MLKAGIVGLPNVGKSTLFNAVTRTRKAVAENYPFCTIDPNIGIVTVPDPRLVVLRVQAARRTIAHGGASEFSRSPTPGDPKDRGLSGEAVADALEALESLAEKSIDLRQPLVVIRFSSKLMA